MAHMVQCVKLGREAEGLEDAPFDSPLGQRPGLVLAHDSVERVAFDGQPPRLLNR